MFLSSGVITSSFTTLDNIVTVKGRCGMTGHLVFELCGLEGGRMSFMPAVLPTSHNFYFSQHLMFKFSIRTYMAVLYTN